MVTKVFTSGRIRKAEYDPASQQLDLHWDNQSVLAYKHVPEEVFRRLCSAPNPTTYWEDRIAEEYPKGTPRASGKGSGGKTLKDLFGESEGEGE
jgi:hypothetical protein